MNRERRRGRYISPHGSKTWEYLSIFACTLLILSLGIVLGWNSPMVVLLSSPDSPIHDNKLDISTLTALLSTGQMLAPVINVLVTDKIGRKYTILLCSLPLVASWSIILMTKSTYMWYVARFLSGIL
ncbi:solute carrier family 2, facilitated glucose transporter member 8-like [Polistes fuscatus]|uniref:solute carrier family 2, facilitated glucose transporter member 8-like n=1 Tax=Polistes fuscatus TaxID=30207 RepID=UPI001CA8ACB5|nr:solute carrier family 2, facilitated glucose transporter member 8-like [Polistes fuscatus]